jgi:hypothetical protein
MSENSPTFEEWHRLYKATVRIKEIAPWQWMTETNVFGVQNPETDELGFISVMGMIEEHYALALYRGAKGLYRFWALQNMGSFGEPERLLEIPQIQASFEDRNFLHKKDREIIKQLGLKFRGKNAWPFFRSHRPGLVPWFLETKEARFLAHALEQALDVGLRFKEDSSVLDTPDGESYLVRVPHQEDHSLVWEDQIVRVPPPESPTIEIPMDVEALEYLEQLPRSRNRIEIDLFMLLSAVQEEKGKPPFFPYILMVVDARSGMILGTELLQPAPSLEAMWGKVPVNVVYQLTKVGILPREVKVRSGLLFQLLQPLAEELGFRLKQSSVLRSLDPAKELMRLRF